MKCLQVIPISLLTLPFAHAEEPRIHVVSSAPFYMGVEDTDGDGLKDLFSGWDRDIVHPTPTLSKNLGNRTFSPYSTPFLPFRSQDRWDGTAWIIEIQPGDRRLFLNHGTHIGDNVYEQTPQTIPLDGNGSGERTAIGPTSLQCWLPLDLDADQKTEFVSFTATGLTTGTLSIMDRQTDGSYSATTLPLADISWSDTEAKPLLADFDNDGDTDLMVFDHEARCHVVYLRTGHRSFAEAPAAIVGGDESINLKPADLDGDGLLDLYSYEGKTLVHYLGQPGLTFGPRQVKDPFASTSTPWTGIHVASNPGAPATLHFTHSSGTTVHWASVRFGTTTVLSEHSTDVSSLRPFTFGDLQPPDGHASEDLDLDGHPDLLISMYVSPGYPTQAVTRHAVAWGRADGFDTPVFVDPVPVRSDILLIGNFDEQSAPDLILGPDPDGYLWFYENSGTGDFPRRVRLDSLGRLHGSVTTISSIRAAEMDGDGILDVVVEYKQQVNFSYNYAHTIAKGLGDGTFHAPVLPEGLFTTSEAQMHGLESLVDWDGDGDLDIVSAGVWRENTGSAFSTEIRPLITGAPLEDIFGNVDLKPHTRVGDVDGDGHPDIISRVFEIGDIPVQSEVIGGADIYESSFAVAFNDGHGGISSIAKVPATLQSRDIIGNTVIFDLRVADLDADGQPDVSFEEYSTTDLLGNPIASNRWIRNPGGVAARNPASWTKLSLDSPLPTTQNPQDDFDGDGIKDWVHATGYLYPSPTEPTVRDGYDFARGIMFPSYDPAKTPADFDGDGDTDILYHRAADVWVVKNTIIDEREEITRYLVAAGVPGQSARPHADADGDGRDNLTELLMGENPLAPESPGANPLAVALETGNEGYHLSFRTPSYAADLGLNYTVEHSTNLTNWQELEGTTPVSASSINGWNFQTLSLPITGPSGYYRLRGHKAPR